VDAATKAHILSRLGLETTSSIMDAVGLNSIAFSEFPPDFQLPHLNQTSDRIELPEEERKTEGHLPTKMVRDLFVLWTPISFLGSYLHMYLRR
jgi:hypothetical protein